MNPIIIQRNYNLADADLCVFASNLVAKMTRDLQDLKNFGVTAQNITDLETLGNVFETFPSDDYFIGTVMIATDAKLAIFDQIREVIRNMATRVELKWGLDSGQYRVLGVTGMTRFDENKLLLKSRAMHETMTKYLADLAAFGLTQAELDAWEALNESCETAMRTQSLAQSERDDSTNNRIKAGNALYEKVAEYCEIGKRVYVKTNPAKYNDYIIYGHAAGPVKPPVNLAYRPGDFVISWNLVENATSYELEYSPDGSAWTVAYSGSDDAVQYIPAVEGWAYFRCRARNSNGYGEFSEVLKAGYYQQIPPPSNVKAKIEEHTENGLLLTWDEVPSAIVYKIYTSVVPIGAASNSYVLLGKPKVNNYSCEIERGKRHYFQLTAENTAQWSQRSAAIYLDVE